MGSWAYLVRSTLHRDADAASHPDADSTPRWDADSCSTVKNPIFDLALLKGGTREQH